MGRRKHIQIYPPEESDKRYFFLSYTTREEEVHFLKEIVDPFLKMIPRRTWEQFGIWYDGVDLHKLHEADSTDQRLKRELIRGLAKSDFTLAMISPLYLRSEWCEFEWQISVQIHRPPAILPACWKRTNYVEHFATWIEPYKIRRQHFATWAKPYGSWRRWLHFYDMPPEKAVEDLIRAVLAYIDLNRPY